MSRALALDGPVRKPSARAICRGEPVSGSIVTSPWVPSDVLRAATCARGLAALRAAFCVRASPALPSRRESKCSRWTWSLAALVLLLASLPWVAGAGLPDAATARGGAISAARVRVAAPVTAAADLCRRGMCGKPPEIAEGQPSGRATANLRLRCDIGSLRRESRRAPASRDVLAEGRSGYFVFIPRGVAARTPGCGRGAATARGSPSRLPRPGQGQETPGRGSGSPRP